MESHDTPSLLPLRISATRNFLKPRRVPLRKLLVLWDQTILTETRDNQPLSLFLNIFRYHEVSETQKIPLRKHLVLWDRTFLTETRDIRPFPHQRYFVIPVFIWNNEGSPYKFFWDCRTKNFRQKIMINPLTH